MNSKLTEYDKSMIVFGLLASSFDRLQERASICPECGEKQIHEFIPEEMFHPEEMKVWDKRVEEKFSNDFADCELAWNSDKKPARIYRFLYSGMLQQDMKNKESRIHPTQKPVALYKWLLSRYAKPGDKILDTHGGSGSICIACHDLGYDLTWMELDKDYYKAACERYNNHAAQGALFEPEEIRQPKQAELI